SQKGRMTKKNTKRNQNDKKMTKQSDEPSSNDTDSQRDSAATNIKSNDQNSLSTVNDGSNTSNNDTFSCYNIPDAKEALNPTDASCNSDDDSSKDVTSLNSDDSSKDNAGCNSDDNSNPDDNSKDDTTCSSDDNSNHDDNSKDVTTCNSDDNFDNSKDTTNSTLSNGASINEQNSEPTSDNYILNAKQGLDNDTSNTEQNSEPTSDNYSLNVKQGLNNDTSNTEQNSEPTSDNYSLHVKQGLNIETSNTEQNSRSTSNKGQGSLSGDSNNTDNSQYLNLNPIKSIISLVSISILVAVIAITFGFAFYYEVASSVIMEYQVTSKYLADVISRHELSSKNSDKVAQYLNQLGDKIGKSGEAIEKMYSTGNFVLKELIAELKSINGEIYQEQVITRQDVMYFAERYEKILRIITKLRDEFRITKNELDDLYYLYNGMHHQFANGIKDVELFFDENKLELRERYRYNIEKLERNFGYLKQIMKKIPDIRYHINNLLSEFDKHRLVVIG
ncbi:4404_t:CDS:2, partial [Racocetra fulgida]